MIDETYRPVYSIHFFSFGYISFKNDNARSLSGSSFADATIMVACTGGWLIPEVKMPDGTFPELPAFQ